MGKPEGKRQLRRRVRQREDNTRMDGEEIECGVMGWTDPAMDREE